jgi:hypothetical protein
MCAGLLKIMFKTYTCNSKEGKLFEQALPLTHRDIFASIKGSFEFSSGGLHQWNLRVFLGESSCSPPHTGTQAHRHTGTQLHQEHEKYPSQLLDNKVGQSFLYEQCILRARRISFYISHSRTCSNRLNLLKYFKAVHQQI